MCKIFFGAAILALVLPAPGFGNSTAPGRNRISQRDGRARSFTAAKTKRRHRRGLALSDLLRLQRLVIVLDRDRAPRFAAAVKAYRDTIALAPADVRSRAFLTATFEVQNRLDGLFIVDPQSNLILRYENGADPEGVQGP